MASCPTRRFAAALLLALALPHAGDAGGVVVCAGSDGAQHYEFACGCADEAPPVAESFCQCACCGEAPAPPADGPVIGPAEGACNDHGVSITAASTQNCEAPRFSLEAAPSILPTLNLTRLERPAGLQRLNAYYSGAPPGACAASLIPLRI